MTNTHAGTAVDWKRELVRARAHKDHGSEEFFTAVARAAESISQIEIAKHLKASQPQVSRWAARGRTLRELENGETLGRSPYHVAQRYSQGEITRDQLITALTNWPYEPSETKTAGLHDDLLNYVAGSFDDVIAAYDDEFIDEDIYSLALAALDAQTLARRSSTSG